MGAYVIDPKTGEKTEVSFSEYDPTKVSTYKESAGAVYKAPESKSSNTPSEKPDFTTPQTDESREQLLRESVQPDTVAQIEHQIIEEGGDLRAYQSGVVETQAKVEALDQVKQVEESYKEAKQEIPQDVREQLDKVKAMTIGQAAPFVKFQKDSDQVKIDIHGALVTGIGEDTLARMGINTEAIKGVRNQLAEQKQDRVVTAKEHETQGAITSTLEKYNYNPLEAIRGGDIAILRQAVNQGLLVNPETKQKYTALDIVDWQSQAADLPHQQLQQAVYEKIKPYMSGDSISPLALSKVMEKGVVTKAELEQSGLFTQERKAISTPTGFFGTVGQKMLDVGRETKGAFTGNIATLTFNPKEYKQPTSIIDIAASYVKKPPPVEEYIAQYRLENPMPADLVIPKKQQFIWKTDEGYWEYITKQEAQANYKKEYGTGTYAKEAGIAMGTALLSPVRVLEPTITKEQIGGGEWTMAGVQLALLGSPLIIKGASAGWARFGRIGTNLTKLEESAQALGTAEKELATINKLTTGAALESPEVAARTQAAIQSAKVARTQFHETFNNLQTVSQNELIRVERLSGVKGLRTQFNTLSNNYSTLDSALAKLENQKVGTTGYSKALNDVAVAKQNYLTGYSVLAEKLQPTLLKTTREFPTAVPETVRSITISPREVIGFTTSRGSTYRIIGEGTQRTMSSEVAAEQGVPALRPASLKTYYLTEAQMQKVGMGTAYEQATYINPKGELVLRGKLPFSGKLNEINLGKVSTKPAVGLSPLEKTVGSSHFGDKIISLETTGGELITRETTIPGGKPNLLEKIFGKITGDYGTPYQTKQGARFVGKQVGLWEEPITTFEFKGLRPITKITGIKIEDFPEAPVGGGGTTKFTKQKVKTVEPETGKIVEKEILVPEKPKAAVATKPKIEVVTETRFKPVYEPKIEEIPYRDVVYGRPDITETPASQDFRIIWQRTASGLLAPVYVTTPKIATITLTETDKMEPMSVPSIIGAPIPEPAIAAVTGTIPKFEEVIISREAIESTPTITPEVTPSPTPIPTPTKLWIPTEITPPEVTYEPPPVWKIPPPIPPKLPSLNIVSSGSISKHGSNSTYIRRFYEIPEMYVALPVWESLKPKKIDKRLWRKFGGLSQGVEVLGTEDEFEITPFGKKSVRTISARVKIASGAQKATPGLTTVEEFNDSNTPLKKKQVYSKSKGKNVEVYEVTPNDIGLNKYVS